jgi:cell division protein FtsA
MLVGLETIQQGAADITDDIASTFGMRRAQAERLKCYYGSALSTPRDHKDVLEAGEDSAGAEGGQPGGVDENNAAIRITKAQLNAVISERIDKIVAEIGRALKGLGFSGPTGHQIVLTGGGAELKGIAEHVQAALGRTVRIGKPAGISGIPEAHSGPAFSTLVGLVRYMASDRADLAALLNNDGGIATGSALGIIERIKRVIRDNF